MALFATAFGVNAVAATKGSNAGHDAVQLWAGGPYWATMNCGATKPTQTGYYYYKGSDTKGFPVAGGKLKGTLGPQNSSTTLWSNGWRKPTTAEATKMKDTCVVDSWGTDADGQVYAVIRGNTAGYTDNKVTFPLSGWANGKAASEGNGWGSQGKYWTSDEGTAGRLCMSKTGIFLQNGASTHENYYTVRMVCDDASGAYSGGDGEGGDTSEISPSGDKTGAKDAAAIQKALDAAKAAKSAVLLGSGTFYLNKELLVAGGVTLEGAGGDKTTVQQVGSGLRVMTVSDGSTVKNLTITGGNYNPGGNYKYGGGVLVSGGNISWCVIKGNSLTAGNTVYGGGVCFTGPGKIDHSIVTENKVTSTGEYVNGGGGIGLSGVSGEVIVDTCLVTKNTVAMSSGHKSGRGGGIGASFNYASTKLTIRNTTIAGNTAGAAGGDNSSKGGAVYTENDSGKTLKMINCIVADNMTYGTGADVNLNYAGGVTYCLFDDEASNPGGTGCKVADPKFTNAAGGNYTLASASPAKGAGTTYSGIGEDLAHNKFGNPPAMGCYEGSGGSDPSSGGSTADYYVSTKGSDSNSGTSRDKPFLTIQHAVDVAAAGKSICVLKGTYNVKAPGTMYKNTAAIIVDKAVKIFGDTGKPEDVIVHNSKDWVESGDYSVCYRVFLLNNAGAVVSGLTVENGNAHGSGSDPKFFGANVFIDTNGGTVTNCIIRNGRSNTFAADVGKADPSTKGGVGGIACFSSQGLITHCVISNNFSSMGRTSTTQTVHDGGAAVYLSAGILRQSLIAHNTVTEAWTGSAVYAAESDGKETLIENCTIVNNKYVQGSKIGNYSDAGQLYPIWIPLNTIDGSSRMPEIRNCVIYGNTTHNGSKALIEWTRYNDAQYAKAKAAAAAAFVNCATDMTLPSGMTAVTSGILLTSDFRPADGSSLIDAGATMKSPVALDLARITRVKRSAVDIGCYEYPEGEQPHSDDPASHTHEWGEPSYVWEETADGYKCIGTVICKGDKTHKHVETVVAVLTTTTAATTEKEGAGYYTATFSEAMFTAQKKDVVIPIIHEHVPTTPYYYVWADDDSSCMATSTCEVCGHKVIEEGEVSAVTNAPTCVESGSVVYSVTFATMGSDTKTVELPPFGHDWDTPAYDWTEVSEGVWDCTGNTVCKNDKTHTTNETVHSTSVVIAPAGETKNGLVMYTTLPFAFSRFTVQTKTVVIPKTGSDEPDPGPSGEGGGDAGGHEGVKLTEDGPYWATMNCGATAVGEVGYYYYNWDDTVGYHVKGGGLTGAVEKNSSVTKWESPWRKPTEAEIRDLVSNCKVTETKTFNGVPCVKVSGTGAYADKYVWFPMAGYANGGSNAGSFGSLGKYWAEGSGGAILQHLMVYANSLGTAAGGANHGNYYTMRLVADKLGPSHKHTWGEPRYTWTKVANGNYTCTGYAVCLSNSTHTVSETVNGVYKCLQEATDTAEGTGVFYATFTKDPFSVDVLQVVIPKGEGDGTPKTPPPGPTPVDVGAEFTVTNICRTAEMFEHCAYKTLTEAILDSHDGDELVITDQTSLDDVTTVFPDWHLTIKAPDEGSESVMSVVACSNGAQIVISPGARVEFKNVVFYTEDESAIEVQNYGVAAFSGTVGGMGVIKTADENGIELSGAISIFGEDEGLMVDCATAKAGGKVGNYTVDAAKIFADKVLNANDPELEVEARDDGSIVWLEPYVAKLTCGGEPVEYRSLDDLFVDVTNDAEIVLLRDCPANCFTNAVTITNKVSITSDDGVFGICPSSTCAFDINEGGELTLENVCISNYTGVGLFRVNEGGVMTLNEGAQLVGLVSAYKGSTPQGPLAVLGGTFNMNSGAVITGCKAANASSSYGGAIYAYKGEANLLGGTITNCSATAGGGVYAYTRDGYATVNLGGDLVVKDNYTTATKPVRDDIRIYKGNASFKVVSELTGSVGVKIGSTSTIGYKEGEIFASADDESIAEASAAVFFHDDKPDFRAEADGADLKWKNVPDDGQRKPSEELIATVIDAEGNAKEYGSMQSLLDHLEGDCTIVLESNATLPSNMVVNANVTLCSSADAVKLGRNVGEISIKVESGATLTISNLTVSAGEGGRMISVENGGSLVLQNGAVVCDLEGGTSRADSGIVVDGGYLKMESGSMVNNCVNGYANTSSDYGIGAGVLLDRGAVADLEGGEIFNCKAYKGGGLAVCNGSTVNVSGDFSCHENYSTAYNEPSDILVEDLSTLYLAGELVSAQYVGRVAGVSGPTSDTNLVGKVVDWQSWDPEVLKTSAAQFRNNRNVEDTGVVVTNGVDEALIVWSSAVSEDGVFVGVSGDVWGSIGSSDNPPVPPEPKYEVVTNTPTAFSFTMIVRSNETQTCTVTIADLVKDAKYSLYSVTDLESGFDVETLEPITNFNAEADGPATLDIKSSDSALFLKAVGETTYVTNYLGGASKE